VEVTVVANGQEALQALDKRSYDCVVVDLVLSGMEGVALIEDVKTQTRFQDLPIVVYTSKDLSEAEETRLEKYAQSVVTKGQQHSVERLMQDTSLLLHRVEPRRVGAPKRARPALGDGAADQLPTSLAGKTVLIVDDDIRNIFAMTSLLEQRGARVVFAENGRAAIDELGAHPETDIVLMDVMMPDMDGYETMRAIRADAKYRSLPIVAVTAKALEEDRVRCLAAGASGYLPKPVDSDKLFDLINVWVLR